MALAGGTGAIVAALISIRALPLFPHNIHCVPHTPDSKTKATPILTAAQDAGHPKQDITRRP